MKRLTALAILICFIALSTFPLDIAAKGSPKKKACASSLAKCPAQGCGGARMDALLNRAKNRVTPPTSSDVTDMTLDEMRHLNQPSTWTANKNRDELKDLGEGKGVRVMAFLWKAKREHRESCNCGLDAPGLKGELLTDIHVVLADQMSDPEAISVTAEVTPRVRAKRAHPETWAQSRVRQLQGKFVRVTGFLMLDTEHLMHNPLVRATNWEVHPITKIEVCTLDQAQCEAGNGWKNVP